MPGARTRERRRRQRLAAEAARLKAVLPQAIEQARTADHEAAGSGIPRPGHGELWQLLREIDRLGFCVWDVAQAVDCTEEERAMIAQVVAPHLAAMTPGSVHRRHKLAT